MSDKIYDIAIIGGGPAGLSAAIYGARGGASCLVFEKMTAGGKAAVTAEVENYPGFKKIDGYELGMKFHEHAEYYGGEIVYEEVRALLLTEKIKKITTDSRQIFAKTVILAMGSNPRTLDLDAEKKFTGRGVSYCATCDGNFYRGKTVAVNGGGNTAAEDALYLADIAKKVYLVHRRRDFRAEKILVDKVLKHPNIELVLESFIKDIIADKTVTAITVENTVTGQTSEIGIDGLFVAIGNIPDTGLVKDVVPLNAAGYVIIDRDGRTNIPGVYAAGDITDTTLKQIVTAAADGAKAAADILKNLR